jgi:chromosome segregation ATPase
MTDEINVGEGMVGQKLPHDVEMIVTAFLPNLKHLESRFDRIDLDIKDLSIGIKDSNNRLSALEKRFDYFEVQVDKRFDLLTHDLRDFKNDTNRRFEQMGNEFREFKGEVKQRFEQVDKRFEQVDKRFEQVDKRFEQVEKRFENVDRRFDQIAASIERLGDKLDARDARQRSFTLRMFGIAISISFLGVLGVLIKTFGVP